MAAHPLLCLGALTAEPLHPHFLALCGTGTALLSPQGMAFIHPKRSQIWKVRGALPYPAARGSPTGWCICSWALPMHALRRWVTTSALVHSNTNPPLKIRR